MMSDAKQIIQDGDINVYVELNNGVINVYSRQKIPHDLTVPLKIKPGELKGRHAEVEKIKSALDQLETGEILQIYGVPGVGKSSLAKYFLGLYGVTYRHVCWIEVDRNLKTSFVSNMQLKDSLVLLQETKGKRTNTVWPLIINRLRQLRGPNLLLIDNVGQDLEQENTFQEIALDGEWKVLVTGREPLLHCIPFELRELGEEGAVELFYDHYGYERHEATVKKIVHQLEYHPLTIEVVAKTADARILKLEETWQLVKKKPQLFQERTHHPLRFAAVNSDLSPTTPASFPPS